jgi:hypothetical protein
MTHNKELLAAGLQPSTLCVLAAGTDYCGGRLTKVLEAAGKVQNTHTHVRAHTHTHTHTHTCTADDYLALHIAHLLSLCCLLCMTRPACNHCHQPGTGITAIMTPPPCSHASPQRLPTQHTSHDSYPQHAVLHGFTTCPVNHYTGWLCHVVCLHNPPPRPPITPPELLPAQTHLAAAQWPTRSCAPCTSWKRNPGGQSMAAPAKTHKGEASPQLRLTCSALCCSQDSVHLAYQRNRQMSVDAAMGNANVNNIHNNSRGCRWPAKPSGIWNNHHQALLYHPLLL